MKEQRKIVSKWIQVLDKKRLKKQNWLEIATTKEKNQAT